MTHDAPHTSRRLVHLLPSGARDVAKRSARRLGTATARRRVLPDFLLLGTKRGGSTSLLRYLQAHPDVAPLFPAMQHLKGVHYFDRHFDRGEDWYRSYFPTTRELSSHQRRTGRPLIAGEASPYYLIHPATPARVAAVCPGIRLVLLVRDPVERAFSHYRDEVALGRETLAFEEALRAERDRVQPEIARMTEDPLYVSEAHEHLSYADYGRYGTHLARWLEVVDAERLLVIASERFFSEPGEVLRDVLTFLGLEPRGIDTSVRFNAAPASGLDPAIRQRVRPAFADEVARAETILDSPLPWGARYRAANQTRDAGTGA